MQMVLPFDAVLCDVDGVLRHWPEADDIEIAHGLPVGAILAAAFADDRLNPALTGQITDAQWRAAVAEDLAVACGDAGRATAAVTAWSELTPRVDERVLELLTAARRQCPVALVTNATTRLESDLRRQGLLTAADAIVSSARVHVAKPDQRIFQIAAAQAGADPCRCLFVDDTAAHVAAAGRLGMSCILYRDPGQLASALRAG